MTPLRQLPLQTALAWAGSLLASSVAPALCTAPGGVHTSEKCWGLQPTQLSVGGWQPWHYFLVRLYLSKREEMWGQGHRLELSWLCPWLCTLLPEGIPLHGHSFPGAA